MDFRAWRGSATRTLRDTEPGRIDSLTYNSDVEPGTEQVVTFQYSQDVSEIFEGPDQCTTNLRAGTLNRFGVAVDGRVLGAKGLCVKKTRAFGRASVTVDVTYTAPDEPGRYPLRLFVERQNSGDPIASREDTLVVGDPDTECESDADCPQGQQCVDGQCVDAPGCVSDSDCPDGFECVDGQCVPVEEGGEFPWLLLLLALGGGGVALYYLTGQNDDERARDIDALENN